MHQFHSDIAFTDTVKAEQSARGSREAYQRQIDKRDWQTTVTEKLAAFIAERNSFYLATANAQGQPYIQHRGGPKGILRVIDETTLGFADYAGNKQYISLGNLSDNDKAYIFLMDYANRQRIKIWGTARVVEGDDELLGRLVNPGYRARPERAILFKIAAWDVNCPAHIPQKYDLADVELVTEGLTARISELEAEVASLRKQVSGAVSASNRGC